MTELETFCPKNRQEWRAWLAQHHQTQEYIWLVFYKKGSPQYNLSWSDAVDEALCFGWIDSTKRSLDEERYQQYFCQRKPKSNWSKINKEKVADLIQKGLMQEAGHASIVVAKENGSWTFLDAIENLVIPEDLGQAFAQQPGSWDYFDSLSKSLKKQLLYWVVSAKRETTRQKRIVEVAENASKQLVPKVFR